MSAPLVAVIEHIKCDPLVADIVDPTRVLPLLQI